MIALHILFKKHLILQGYYLIFNFSIKSLEIYSKIANKAVIKFPSHMHVFWHMDRRASEWCYRRTSYIL